MYRIRPLRVFALSLLVLLLGASPLLIWYGLRIEPELVQHDEEVAELNGEVGRLQERVDQLNTLLTELDRSMERGEIMRMGRVPLPQPEQVPAIRVALSRQPSLSIAGTGLSVELPDGERTQVAAEVRAWLDEGRIRLPPFDDLPEGSLLRASDDTVRLGGQPYRGAIELRREDDKVLAINHVDLEEYIAGVVAREVVPSWGIETKSAQAVAARTYALYQRAVNDGPYDVESTTADQVYGGADVPTATRRAVERTRGQVLAVGGELVKAYYSSTCGGHTEDPRFVWGTGAVGLTPVECHACARAPSHSWDMLLGRDLLSRRLREAGYELSQVTGLDVISRSPMGRIDRLAVLTDAEPIGLSGQELRMIVGPVRLKSTWFEAEVEGNGFRLEGRGFGHGVGMCQWGARGLEREDYDYREILAFYYPRARIAELY